MAHPRQPGRVRVLLVDDSVVVRRSLRALLQETERIVVVGEAGTAREGLALAAVTRPDVVVLDIRLPGTSGLAVLRELKASPAPPLVIVLTNYPYQAYANQTRALGGDYFFDKSTDFSKAIAVLSSLAA